MDKADMLTTHTESTTYIMHKDAWHTPHTPASSPSSPAGHRNADDLALIPPWVRRPPGCALEWRRPGTMPICATWTARADRCLGRRWSATLRRYACAQPDVQRRPTLATQLPDRSLRGSFLGPSPRSACAQPGSPCLPPQVARTWFAPAFDCMPPALTLPGWVKKREPGLRGSLFPAGRFKE